MPDGKLIKTSSNRYYYTGQTIATIEDLNNLKPSVNIDGIVWTVSSQRDKLNTVISYEPKGIFFLPMTDDAVTGLGWIFCYSTGGGLQAWLRTSNTVAYSSVDLPLLNRRFDDLVYTSSPSFPLQVLCLIWK